MGNIKDIIRCSEFVLMTIGLSAMLLLESTPQDMLYRTLIVFILFICSICIRVYYMKGIQLFEWCLLLTSSLYFLMFFVYGNFYCADVNLYGNNSVISLWLFSIFTIITVGKYDCEYIIRLIKITTVATFVIYVSSYFNLVLALLFDTTVGVARLGEFSIDGIDAIAGVSNKIAMNVILLSVIPLYELIKKRKKIFCLPVMLSIVVTVLTGSKKGILGIAVLFFLYGVVFSKEYKRNLILFMLSSIGVVVILLNNDFLYIILGNRIEDIFGFLGIIHSGPSLSTSNEIRSEMYKVGISMFLDSPIYGNGLRAFQTYLQFKMYSHCNYIEMLCTFGLIGFSLFYSYIACVFIILKKRILDRNATVDIIIAYLILDMFFDLSAVRFDSGIYIFIINISLLLADKYIAKL